eukprot:CAMPEP_0183307740 /NCGR_PEP_ID=MMETSP0160_2-20130417/19131_1 /TAXON_ID=2839 ORGANISM="Odontella Sinensis, Strain Grunow 1884" /NCGR_SAMPLE_ID=MMETSP0160_2 /ASSEMBLY_ACC=CAM_ASM_000250 /LENGTH=120 /DNA_ID=CAMNT_0025471401 /DNA_START=159 /DNA_END=522 /DNA_ORIENTATION=+
MSSPVAAGSKAARVLQRRAIQCSFSSVFHLRNGGMGHKEAKEAERLFLTAVGLPLGLMGAAGVVASSEGASLDDTRFFDKARTHKLVDGNSRLKYRKSPVVVNSSCVVSTGDRSRGVWAK